MYKGILWIERFCEYGESVHKGGLLIKFLDKWSLWIINW